MHKVCGQKCHANGEKMRVNLSFAKGSNQHHGRSDKQPNIDDQPDNTAIGHGIHDDVMCVIKPSLSPSVLKKFWGIVFVKSVKKVIRSPSENRSFFPRLKGNPPCLSTRTSQKLMK